MKPTPKDITGSTALNVIAKAGKFNRWMFEVISRYVQGSTLEIGSGIGNISCFFVENNFDITLSDVDVYYVDILKHRFSNNRNVRDVLTIDLQYPAFSDKYADLKEQFETIFMLNVLEHLADEKAAIENCKYLLKPGGRLIILVPAYTWLYSRMDKELGHFRRYTKHRLHRLLAGNNLRLLKGFYFNSPGIIAWLYGKILSFKVVPEAEMGFFDRIVPIARLTDKVVAQRVGLSVISIVQKQTGSDIYKGFSK